MSLRNHRISHGPYEWAGAATVEEKEISIKRSAFGIFILRSAIEVVCSGVLIKEFYQSFQL